MTKKDQKGRTEWRKQHSKFLETGEGGRKKKSTRSLQGAWGARKEFVEVKVLG